MRKTLLFIILIFSSAISCSSFADANAENSETSKLVFDTISLSRTGCYGECPVYTIYLFANGRLLYDGEKFVKISGMHEAMVNAEDLKNLSDMFKVDIFGLRDNYEAPEDGCEISGNDYPAITISISKGSIFKKIIFDYGCYGKNVPRDFLIELSQKIDGFARAKGFVGQ
jgi:hypothetical protein